jgi:transglutaminase-like putative cysteine protease
LLLPAWALIAAVAPVGHAQPVLHEYVPEEAADELEALVSDGAGGASSVVVYDGEVFPAPQGGGQRADERPMGAAPDGAGGPAFRPDRLTELEDVLGYYAVFTPSVAPFKRVTALDAVRMDGDGRTPVLAVHDPHTRALRVEGEGVPAPDGRPRDQFWGNVILDFRDGRRVPLPSVSPESRILSARAEPEVPLRFEKDGADAYFVSVVGPVPAAPVRVIFLTDAPRAHFGATLPPVAADVLAHEVPPMPPSVRARARAFAGELGLAPTDPLPKVLTTLARHFRSFEESPVPPRDQGDIYLDLARGMKGVCRHRTYAFVITAQALGLPSRFVYNEAHSWSEVRIPEVGWMRVDLGGAARGLETHGAADRPVYRPDAPDPLPRPAAYDEGYSQLGGDVTGLRDDPSGTAARSSSPGGRNEVGEPTGDNPSASAPSRKDWRSVASGRGRDDRDPRAQERTPLRLMVDAERYETHRGRTLEVAGRAVDPRGQGVAGLRIEVLLRRRGEVLVGVTVTGAGGRFSSAFAVPPDLPVGDYDLVVRTPGDRIHTPAVAR